MEGSRTIVRRKVELARDGEAREGERENDVRNQLRGWVVQLTVVERGQETESNQQFWFLYQSHPSSRSITLAGRPSGILVQMPPKPISTLALPRSTLFALSQAGYETTDELASSTPESLARGKPVFPDQ